MSESRKRIFVSASTAEKPVAEALITQLNNAFEGDLVFTNSARDLAAGDQWKSWIRTNLSECDAGLFLITPTYLASPWLVAEFIVFWLAEKPIFLLLADGVRPEDLFRPMQDDYQTTSLSDTEGLRRFMRNLSDLVGRERTPYEFTELLSFKCVEALKSCDEERNSSVSPSTDPSELVPADSTFDRRHRNYEAAWTMSLNEDHETLRGECVRTEHVVCQSGMIHYIPITVAQAANIVPFDRAAEYPVELLDYEYPKGRVTITRKELSASGDFSFRVRFTPPLTQGVEARFTCRFMIPSLKVANVDHLRELLQANEDAELRNYESFTIQVHDPTDRFIYSVSFPDDCLIEPELPDVTWRRSPIAKESAALLQGAYACTTTEGQGWQMRLERDHPIVETRYTFKWKLPRRSDLA